MTSLVDERIEDVARFQRVDHRDCDDCGLVVDTLAALTRFCVGLGHLERALQFCARCNSGGLAAYWTRDRRYWVIDEKVESKEIELPATVYEDLRGLNAYPSTTHTHDQ